LFPETTSFARTDVMAILWLITCLQSKEVAIKALFKGS
jgi:hypothetical protein